MKKLYFHNYVFFAICFLLLFFSSRHTSFANENLPKETLPISRPKPVFKAPFKPLPFKTLLTNVELYEFNPKAYAFDKIVGLQPILVGKDWQTVTNDPIKFTLTPSKPTAMLGEEIELTLTAELLDISPRLLFTLEELRSYSIKVILPQDFIQTGGTYINFATGTLDPSNPKHTYTIKGRYLDKPAQEDCFKVLRKLSDGVFVLKNTTCPTVTDADIVSLTPVISNAVQETELGIIDLTKVSFYGYSEDINKLAKNIDFTKVNATTYTGSQELKCTTESQIRFGATDANYDEVVLNGGSIKWELYRNDSYIGTDGLSTVTTSAIPVLPSTVKVSCKISIYNNASLSGTPIETRTYEVNINRVECPTNTLSIDAKETSLCPGASTTITTTTNCPETSISWQKDGLPYGSNGATTSVSTSGTYKAVCNSPAMVSKTVTINVSNTPTAPNISTNRHAITPGEFATLTATNCRGTVEWYKSTSLIDVGDEISTNRPGSYKAICRSVCNGTPNDSEASGSVDIALLPLRLEADKYEIYANETAQISAYGCNNGYISWKLNGSALPNSDNPLTAYGPGVYQAQCTSFNGPSSDAVSIYIGLKNATSPRIVSVSKTQAYPSDVITVSATGCPNGWYYAWFVPINNANGSVTIDRRMGATQTGVGPGEYKVQCVLNAQEGAFESVYVSMLNIGDITITPNKSEANQGETVIFTATGNCPNGAGIRWFINGMNYWTWAGETFQATGPGEYSARCESGYQIGKIAYYNLKEPKAGAISIVADKPRAKDNELVTLRAIGCDKEVIWTLPNSSQRAGTSVLFNYGPGVYKAACVRFGFTSEPASITIAERNWNEPYIVNTNGSISSNEVMVLTIEGCPNNWVGWRQPYTDPNTGATYEQISSQRSLVINQPGVYKYHCAVGDYTAYQEIVVQPAAPGSLVIKADKSVARVDEPIVLTAYGCPNGVIEWLPAPPTTKPDGSPNPIVPNRATYYTPGLRQARCIGDISNNGDWAMAYTKMEGTVAPILTADKTEACPTEPVTITLSGCPNGWYYQTQWVNPGMLDYWMTHRQDIDDLGNGYFDVFSFGGGTLNKQGPNMYFGRCISPDGGWMGDFREKYITIEPAFPTDLRATNNGPAITGAALVKLAVTEAPGASYVWSGPSFSSFSRVADIENLTEAKSGIYTVTLNRGAGLSWGCSATATTKVVISGCDIRIKASDVITSEERYELPFAEGSMTQFRDLALSAIRYNGTEPQGLSYTWTKPDGTIDNSSILVTNKPGRYSLSVSPIDNPSIVCKSFVTISESSAYKVLFSKVRNRVFSDGTPVKVVPIQYEDMYYTLTRNGVEEKIDIAENYLLFYSSGGVKKVDMMQVIPTYDYNQTHGVINEVDFSGLIVFTGIDGQTFKKGWRFNNGVVDKLITATDIAQARLKSPNDICVYSLHYTKTSTIIQNDGISTVNPAHENIPVSVSRSSTTYWSISLLSLECCIIVRAGCGSGVPSTDPPPFNPGGGSGTPPSPSDISKMLCRNYVSLLGESNTFTPKMQIINTNCVNDLAGATRFSVYAKLLDESVKKEFAKKAALQPYLMKMIPATDAQINSAYNAAALNGYDIGELEAAGCALTQNFLPDATNPIDSQQAYLISEALQNSSNDVKLAYTSLSKLLTPCSSNQGCSAPSPQSVAVMNTVMASLKNRKGAVINGFQWSDFGDRIGMEAGDITNLFSDLVAASGNSTVTDPASPNIIRLLPVNGPFTGIEFTYDTEYKQLDIKNCDNTIFILDGSKDEDGLLKDVVKKINTGRQYYTCNCGWIDANHAFTTTNRDDKRIGIKNLWNQVLNETGRKSLLDNGYLVEYRQDAPFFGVMIGVTKRYFVRYGLNLEQRKQIALAILQEVSIEFEALQDYGKLAGRGDSSFEPSDLVSNLLSFYNNVNGMTEEQIINTCGGKKTPAESLAIYKQYPGTFSEDIYKNKTFIPKFFNNPYCVGTPSFPASLQQITPAVKGNTNNTIFRNWLELFE